MIILKLLRLDYDIVESKSGKVLAKLGDKFNSLTAKNIKKEGVKKIFIDNDSLIGKYLSKDIYDSNSGIIFFEAGDKVTKETITFLDQKNIDTIEILNINRQTRHLY